MKSRTHPSRHGGGARANRPSYRAHVGRTSRAGAGGRGEADITMSGVSLLQSSSSPSVTSPGGCLRKWSLWSGPGLSPRAGCLPRCRRLGVRSRAGGSASPRPCTAARSLKGARCERTEESAELHSTNRCRTRARRITILAQRLRHPLVSTRCLPENGEVDRLSMKGSPRPRAFRERM